VPLSDLVRNVGDVMSRADSLFGTADPDAAATAADKLTDATDVIRSGHEQAASMSGDVITNYADFAQGTRDALDHLSGVESDLGNRLREAAEAVTAAHTASQSSLDVVSSASELSAWVVSESESALSDSESDESEADSEPESERSDSSSAEAESEEPESVESDSAESECELSESDSDEFESELPESDSPESEELSEALTDEDSAAAARVGAAMAITISTSPHSAAARTAIRRASGSSRARRVVSMPVTSRGAFQQAGDSIANCLAVSITRGIEMISKAPIEWGTDPPVGRTMTYRTPRSRRTCIAHIRVSRHTPSRPRRLPITGRRA